ncbi:hypothetical protein I9018_18225 [Pseudomonas sp. MPFS]|nr:hypothetical protein I9018_18225 [Pseudomonas sp. MPFS]
MSFIGARSMESGGPAAFSNPDAIKGSVQGIQGIDECLCLGLPTFSPEAFSHFVKGQDGPFDVRSGCGGCTCGLVLGHLLSSLKAYGATRLIGCWLLDEVEGQSTRPYRY